MSRVHIGSPTRSLHSASEKQLRKTRADKEKKYQITQRGEEDQSSMGQRGEVLEKMIAGPDCTVGKCVINGNLNQLH